MISAVRGGGAFGGRDACPPRSGSPRHSAICSNIARILGTQLRGAPRRVCDANLRVRSVAADRSTYADATVVCGALELDPADRTQQTVLDPTVLIEVLSPSVLSFSRAPGLPASWRCRRRMLPLHACESAGRCARTRPEGHGGQNALAFATHGTGRSGVHGSRVLPDARWTP
ncbi:MAG: Uma2 family endonuclease [Polyangiaceae bacterium]|nr:Uma2 family endonuclease [Polyangiaceae bacterium]